MSETDGARILVVEDDDSLRGLLVEELREAGYTVTAVGTAPAAREVLDSDPVELVVSDLRLPGSDGMALLRATREGSGGDAVGFIVITAFGTISQAVEALKAGADDFLTKPLDLEHLLLGVGRVLEHRRLRRRVSEFEALLGGDDFHGLIGRSRPMQALFTGIRRIGAGEGPVLVTGESGTGKELVARAVHAESPRQAGPFIAVNCAGVPAELLESEFFGHVQGAFTGAHRARAGLFQAADGGTLFLDEIAEMPAALQAKLLRVLEDSRVRPVGADREQAVDLRIVAATHQDLEAAVERGDFRADLFYRLETFRLPVPPLRERGDDVDLLAARLVSRFAQRLGRATPRLAPETLACLRRYAFPGNVRELANAIERAVTFADGDSVQPADLPERVRRPGTSEPSALPDGLTPASELPPLAEVERRYIQQVMEAVDGNKRRAADILGIGRRTLYRKLDGDEA
ncbi:sigma-54-dependent transcriptional regulator [Spiribacter halobius]|uniref:Sigma-54-dependent Fis family transcriptional regulator n=1 Tax=Sediminicurvatus halobius TaxID=2182432 RepID=A0A2U2MWU3_9GAMM|nr:sigma-54 dependent transcriptional regulator [Spiribacter halobius]PWG61292.1 sigma-54-dependent Fis family transcriptional regulator [Spiribacter halobius]UEX78965.1 sigma-54 dependent transcriptional regulator [Spiribacter halobius]